MDRNNGEVIMSKSEKLTEDQVEDLRSRGLIEANEFVYKAGDLIVAEDPTTGTRRIVGQTNTLSESNKRVLRG